MNIMNIKRLTLPRSNWGFRFLAFNRKPYRPDRRIVLCRIKWETGTRMQKGWHDNKFSISLVSRIWNFTPELWGWCITIVGVRLHHKRAYGGHFPR